MRHLIEVDIKDIAEILRGAELPIENLEGYYLVNTEAQELKRQKEKEEKDIPPT